jgi:hypothetical protein
MSRENKGKPPRPQLRQPRYDQLKLPRFPVDPLVEVIAQRVRAETEQEQEQSPEPERGAAQQSPPREPVDEPTVTQSSSGPGAPRIEWPHLSAALDALQEKWPDIKRVTKKHRKFVIKYLRDHGDEVAVEFTEAGQRETSQDRTIGRRIRERLNLPES